ncbi:YxD-tail cyclophane-containing RiPP peptide [Streptomyces sp. NPDC003077]|uniref:YxD-tail cyclophane-containing RiPP peptide n=1 Tax=Streptomyces sp. NPDC003077 TaxID=3154443 RepID=UPI0033B62F48
MDSPTGRTPVIETPGDRALPDFGRPDLAALRAKVAHPVLADVVDALEHRAARGGTPVAYYDDGPGGPEGR